MSGPGKTPRAAVEAYFHADGHQLVPTHHAHGTWREATLDGRYVAALLARAVEQDHAEGGFFCSRLTVELMRPVPAEPIHLEARRVRDGKLVRSVDAVLTAGGVECARASALLVSQRGAPGEAHWSRPPWSMPPPRELEPLDPSQTETLKLESRTETPTSLFPEPPRRLWLRDPRPLVDGEPWTPFTHAVAMADLANPLANVGDGVLDYINADLTVYLVRPPVGGWVGIEVVDHLDHAGVMVATCALHDTEDRVGWVTLTGPALRHPQGPPREGQ